MKYFLYVYSPDYIEDDLNASYDVEQINTSLEFETGTCRGLKCLFMPLLFAM